MPETIFDLIEDEMPEGKEGYFALAEKAPKPKEKSFLNDVSDYAKTFIKGTIEGFEKLGTAIGPTGKAIRQPEKELEKLTESLNQILPTDEGFIQRGIRRGLKEAPTFLATPGGSTLSNIPRSIVAGFLGEGAKELGAPEWAQSALELTSFITPDITKKLLSSGKNKELIEFAKKMGMTDEQITPLLQSDFKQKWLTKLSPKRGSTQKALTNTKNALSETYGTLQKSEAAGKEISEVNNGKLINSLLEKLNEIPREIRGVIEKDLNDLLNNKITGKSLINFWKDINSNLSWKTKQLSTLKEPIKKALNTISPELSKDFEMTNDLFSKYYNISAKLKPNLTTDIISAAEALGVIGSITLGHYPHLVHILGEKSARKLAQQMLINPHFQQLSKKMIVALNQNKFGLAQKLTDEFRKEIKKFSPEIAEKIENLSLKEFENLVNPH